MSYILSSLCSLTGRYAFCWSGKKRLSTVCDFNKSSELKSYTFHDDLDMELSNIFLEHSFIHILVYFEEPTTLKKEKKLHFSSLDAQFQVLSFG